MILKVIKIFFKGPRIKKKIERTLIYDLKMNCKSSKGLKKENNREALILESRGKIQCKCIKKKQDKNRRKAMILKLESKSKIFFSPLTSHHLMSSFDNHNGSNN